MTVDELLELIDGWDERKRTELAGRLSASLRSDAVPVGRPAYLDAACAYAAARERATGIPWMSFGANQRAFSDVVDALRPIAKMRGVTVAALCRESAEGFIADPAMKAKKWPVAFWSKSPGDFLQGADRGAADPLLERQRGLERRCEDALQLGRHEEAERLRAEIAGVVKERRAQKERSGT